MLEASHLYKSYRLYGKNLDILRGASFSVQTGESLAIVGRSGAGKSTLLHVLGGLDRPNEGTVLIDGISLYELSARKRTRLRAAKIGFVFQAYHLLPEMDITENVMLPAMALGIRSRREMRMHAEALLERVGLSERLRHTPLELSGGEQQRAAIARALMNDPPLILADEPTGNLDARTGTQVLDLLFALAQERGTILAMVTHNPETAARCTHTRTLEDGKLL
ncbi:MAG: ABC transporter ATP-binding protein [Kiritimatiellia bacterium]